MFIKANVIFEDDESTCNESFFCPLCEFPLKSGQDFFAYDKYECCAECFLTFAESRKEAWKDGWRPDKTRLEEYIYLRKSTFLLNTTREKK